MSQIKQVISSLTARWSRPARGRDAYLVAALIGLSVNLAVFGLGHLTGTSSYWDLPEIDARAHLMGYRYFLAEPWHWPVFEARTINVPFTKNIFYTDSIPLFALLNKAIATVVPPWGRFTMRSYLGIWHALVYTLQCVFGVALVREVGRRSISDAFWTSIVFLSFPAFVYRYGHASLSAHFLLLCALLLYLRSGKSLAGDRVVRGQFVAFLVIAALINPYHMAMGLALFAAALTRFHERLKAALWLVIGIASTGVTVWLAGFVAREARIHMTGFETSSTNVLAPFVPVRSIVFGNAKWLPNVNAVPYQYEGYIYFGLGLLALCLLFLIHVACHPRVLASVARRHPALLVLVLGTWAYSLSNHVYFGSHRVLVYAWPRALAWVTEQYRAPGRFVWLPAYVVVVYVLAWALDRFKTGRWRFVVPVLAIVQVIDGGLGDWKAWRDQTRTTLGDPLGLPAWSSLIRSHSSVEQLPTYDCILDGSVPVLDYVAQEIQYLSSDTTIPINGVYSARPTRDCAVEARAIQNPSLHHGTLYVVYPQGAAGGRILESQGASCADFVYGKVCSSDRAAIENAKRAGALHDPPELNPGTTIELAHGVEGLALLRHGWLQADGGVWTFGPTAALSFRLPKEGASELVLRASPKLCSGRAKNAVDVSINGEFAATLDFEQPGDERGAIRRVRIPASAPGGSVNVQLRPHDVRSLREIGCGSDERRLGIMVHAMWVE